VYYQGRLYARNPGANVSGLILDSQSGALVGSFAAGPAPALAGSTRYTLSAGVLSAVDLTSGATLWTFSGDGTLSSAPIVVNAQVYVGGTSGTLYALDAGTGKQLWTTAVGAGIPAPDEQNVTQPLTGLNAGDGLLVVPAGNLLVAYAAAPPATPTPSPTSSPTATATSTPTSTPSPTATSTPTSTATPSPSPTSTSTATPTPSKKGHGH
jgi:outer membrane protein assembly factor BamB